MFKTEIWFPFPFKSVDANIACAPVDIGMKNVCQEITTRRICGIIVGQNQPNFETTSLKWRVFWSIDRSLNLLTVNASYLNIRKILLIHDQTDSLNIFCQNIMNFFQNNLCKLGKNILHINSDLTTVKTNKLCQYSQCTLRSN